MFIIEKIENRHYEFYQVLKDGTRIWLSRLIPSTVNKKQYAGMCYGAYERFKTVEEWKMFLCRAYGYVEGE